MDDLNPYIAPQTDISHDAKDAAVEYMGFWPRVGASILDNIILSIVTLPILYMIYGDAYFLRPEDQAWSAGGADILLSYIFPFIAILSFWIYKSATPGKMMLHAKIVDAETLQPTTTGRLVARYLGYFVSMLTLGLGFLWIAFDKRKQGLHDKIARTVVIRSYD